MLTVRAMRAVVIEHDPQWRGLVREALEEAGWTVDVAEDGIAALGRIRRHRPDLVVLDLLLPKLAGGELLRLLRASETGRRIPVLVATGVNVAREVRELASAVLRKPFSEGELLRAAASLELQGHQHA
ncbi:MAG TPA: response regulator [Anaeromyxobacter sp.]|nr:response regulator [Anaeromyxobacter sp.]